MTSTVQREATRQVVNKWIALISLTKKKKV